MSPRKLISRERKTFLIISLLLLVVILLTFLETYLQGVSLTSRFITNNIIVFAVVNINIILLMILVLLVFRNLIKLYFEHRRKILGSKFKTKLILAFSLLSIIPAIVLFIVSLTFINKSIQNWFEIRVEEVLKGTNEISRDYYQFAGEHSLRSARSIVRKIDLDLLSGSDEDGGLLAYLGSAREEYNISRLQVFNADMRKTISSDDPRLPVGLIPDPSQKHIQQALQGLEINLVESAGPGEVIRSIIPLASPDEPLHIRGALASDTYIASSIGNKVKDITATYENYRQSKILKNPIRVSYQVTLGMIFLMIIFWVTWFSFYLARFITVPIQKLAEGTRRISEGSLDFKIDFESKDELGMLVSSFNNMTDDLKANKTKLESAYRHLEKSNLELQSRKLYIETVLDNIATGVISLDPKGRLTTVNKAAQTMLGLRGSRNLNRFYEKAFKEDSYADIRDFIDELHSQSLNWLERRIDLVTEGSSLNLLLIGSNLYDEKMKYSGSVIVLENLTEMISAQRIAAWREVARRIAHEIKNPLTPIKLSAQRLRKKFFRNSDDFDNVFDEGTQMIIGQVDELRKLVDEFSRFAKMPSSKPTATDIHNILENTLLLYRETYKDMTFKTNFHPGPLMIMADVEQMKRAFVNLIDNSIEATGQAGTIEMETAYDKNSRSVRIFFKDDGRGIPLKDRDKLFIPYFSTKKEGTGLGLTIVSSIISDHCGYIRIKNNTPKGTVFIIEIPALKKDKIKT